MAASTREKVGMSSMLSDPGRPERTIPSLMGSRYFAGIDSRPYKTPAIVPTLPALQSVSQPHMVAISTVRDRSPAP